MAGAVPGAVRTLPAGFEDTALVVPTSGSTGTAKAVALSRSALLASQDATAALLAADGTAPDTQGHGFWLPLLPPTHIAGVQVIARAHRTAQVLGLAAPALPDPLPDLRGHFDAAAFVASSPSPVLAQAENAGLPAFTSLVPTQLTRIVTGTTGADARARGVLRRFAAVLVGGAATQPRRARDGPRPEHRRAHHLRLLGDCRRLRVRPRPRSPGCSWTSRRPMRPVPDACVITSPALAMGYLTAHGGTDTTAVHVRLRAEHRVQPRDGSAAVQHRTRATVPSTTPSHLPHLRPRRAQPRRGADACWAGPMTSSTPAVARCSPRTWNEPSTAR